MTPPNTEQEAVRRAEQAAYEQLDSAVRDAQAALKEAESTKGAQAPVSCTRQADQRDRKLRGVGTTVVFRDAYEWDVDKAAANTAKHGVTFEEATTVFDDEAALIAADFEHADRFVIIGVSASARVLFVVYAELVRAQGERVRIISARRASPSQRKRYEKTR